MAFFSELNTADKKKLMIYMQNEQNTIPVLSDNGSTAHNDNEKANMHAQQFLFSVFQYKLPQLTPFDSQGFLEGVKYAPNPQISRQHES